VVRRTVLTAIGQDRPGLVEEVSAFVFERGGSIEESRMVNLLGQFAIAMVVSGSDNAINGIAADVDLLRSKSGIDARLTPVEPMSRRRAPAYRLVTRAFDQPGLVHEVAEVLRRFGANVETLDTSLEPAPVTGTPLFTMDMVITTPTETAIETLERDLGHVCHLLNIDWTLTPIDDAVADDRVEGARRRT
jgi:glycine cleavage system transcriptional repressor